MSLKLHFFVMFIWNHQLIVHNCNWKRLAQVHFDDWFLCMGQIWRLQLLFWLRKWLSCESHKNLANRLISKYCSIWLIREKEKSARRYVLKTHYFLPFRNPDHSIIPHFSLSNNTVNYFIFRRYGPNQFLGCFFIVTRKHG